MTSATSSTSRPSPACARWKAARRRTSNGASLRRRGPGRPLHCPVRGRRRRTRAGQARHHQGQRDLVVRRCRNPAAPRRRRSGHGSTYNGRLFSAIVEQNQPIGMLWDWQVFDYDGWIVPEGLDDARLNRVMHFLNFATDTQRLADQASTSPTAPPAALPSRSSRPTRRLASRCRPTCPPTPRTRRTSW